jgi:hypothetical protein
LIAPSLIAAGISPVSSVNATDSFNRANQNPIGSPWTALDPVHLGTGQILNNQFESSVVGSSDSIYAGSSWPNDQGSQITIAALNGSSYIGIDLRGQNIGTASGKAYRCYVGPGSTSDNNIPWAIQLYNAGSFNQLASGTLSGGIRAGDTLEADVVGTTITFYHSGISFGTVTDTNLSSGQPGLLTAPSGSTVNSAVSTWSGLAVTGTSNEVVQLRFNKRIDPFTVTNSTFLVYPQSTGIPISGSITVSADGLTATFVPSASLSSATVYGIQATNGILDLEGQAISFSSGTFRTF